MTWTMYGQYIVKPFTSKHKHMAIFMAILVQTLFIICAFVTFNLLLKPQANTNFDETHKTPF